MSIQQSFWDGQQTQQDAVSAPRRIEVTPTANRESLKRLGRRERILARLQEGSARTWELMALGGSGFSSRLKELRNDGHRIVCIPDEDGATYRLEE